jgi:hypothetical protein
MCGDVGNIAHFTMQLPRVNEAEFTGPDTRHKMERAGCAL